MDEIVTAVKVPLDHPLFYSRAFALAAKERRASRKGQPDDPLSIMAEEYEELSRRLDRSQIQESCSVRNVWRTRRLAQLLVDSTGEIALALLPALIEEGKKYAYSLGPSRQYDGKRHEHILKVLQLLSTQKEWVRLLKKFTRPLSNKWAEELIRHTLQLPATVAVTDAHTRQAVLSAWLCYLRQNVGSCFATAPAEIIHDEQPELFLQDVLDLMATGRLTRTFGGVENSVPLSASWGSGDLKKPLVIRISRKGVSPEIWHSPGLIAAFESVGFLKAEDPIKQKIQQLEGWIRPLIQQERPPFISVVTAEEIIRKLLLQAMGITERQIQEYQSRPKEAIPSTFMVRMPNMARNGGGIGERCRQFLQLFEEAKNSFKSLTDNALLKAWEFTLASFSDIKYELARWNFYASLGLGTHEVGGIGPCIHQAIQHKLDAANQKAQEIQYEYEMVYTQVKTLEARMRHASTEKEVQWLKIDYQSRLHDFYFLEEQRNAAQHHATVLVKLYDALYQLYVDLFKDYFQEVYDANMQEVTTGPFDDSPAGFRLLYKHGRSNTSQWTRIQGPDDFIEALTAFFVATEPQIAHALEEKKIEKDLAEVVTAIINHVKTKEFLEGALHRMAAAHRAPLIRDPLDHLDQIEKKPWAYTSGGTMNTLVSCYYRIEDKPKEVEKWVESEMELLVYLADTLKQMPPSLLSPYLKGERRSLLMQSPTHAFLLQPTLFPFNEAWNNEEFTYTFIRDRFVLPAEMFIEGLLLSDEMLFSLTQKLSEKIPENYLPRFQMVCNRMAGPLNPLFFREYLADALSHDRGLRYDSHPVLSTEEIDSLLYSTLPLFPIDELKERIEKMVRLLPGLSSEAIPYILELLERLPLSRGGQPCLGAAQLQDICKALLCLSGLGTSISLDYPLLISAAARKLGFALPAPLIFADSNWVKEMFGFVVNPGTGRLELWRVDYTGSSGTPLSSWKQWVDGSRPDQKWGIYIKPFQYGQS